MTDQLPVHPNISQLKRQAKDLKRAVREGEAEGLERARRHRPDLDPAGFGLRDAQLVIAREHGFDGWHTLLEEVGERMVDERDLHRWFAVHLNNDTWAALDAGDVGPGSPAHHREALLYGAYAAAYHWLRVGTPVHQARAEHLIARAALRVGRPDVALHHARRCLDLVAGHPADVEDWDVAFAHEAMARACAAAGDTEGGRRHLATAERLGAAIADDGDREVFLGELGRGEWFGLSPGEPASRR